jgi:glycosyltransferase involved in cell wall biosynthesis
VGVELKLLVAINSLDSGGAEKSALKLAEGLHRDGNEVVFLTFTSNQDFYEPLSLFPRITLDTRSGESPSRSLGSIVPRRIFFWIDQMVRLIRLRKVITDCKPDCVISISASVAVFVYISALFLKVPQVGSERINPDKNVFSHGKIVDIMRPFIYRHGVNLSVQTKGIQNWCYASWNCESVVTPNHLSFHPQWGDPGKGLENSDMPSAGFILAIGRDHPQKNFDFLLKAWRQYEVIGGSRELVIVGPVDPKRLELSIKHLGIRNVRIFARTLDLSPFYESAQLFVSTSRFEGFPNVILEALSFGIPVISTPSCDLIREFELGGCCVMTDSSSEFEFAERLKNTEENEMLIQSMSQLAVEVSLSYTWESVRDSWYKCISLAISRQRD